jgi:hypothetical protein
MKISMKTMKKRRKGKMKKNLGANMNHSLKK